MSTPRTAAVVTAFTGGAITAALVTIFTLGGDKRAALREALARVADWVRVLREQLTRLAHRIVEALRPLGEQLRTLGERLHTTRHRDRPAWCSPYGPAPRRRR